MPQQLVGDFFPHRHHPVGLGGDQVEEDILALRMGMYSIIQLK